MLGIREQQEGSAASQKKFLPRAVRKPRFRRGVKCRAKGRVNVVSQVTRDTIEVNKLTRTTTKPQRYWYHQCYYWSRENGAKTMLELRKGAQLPTGEKEAHSGCVSTQHTCGIPALLLCLCWLWWSLSLMHIFSASTFPFMFLQFCFSKQHQIS